VPPAHRGKGVATALVEAGFRAADTLGLDTYVLGMRIGLGMYKKAGFRFLDEVVQDASRFGGEKEYAAYMLVKEPSS